ncbi:MAG: NCS2 family nucleobase:cation symporter [Lactobacillaceae bacterium]|jgi:uracil permease|nr:NCS2 family nucleobase:cation symporter [Lactobacillaceae bacterium]
MTNKNGSIYDVDQIPPVGKFIGLSLQHLFSMFGATVLVPLLVGLNPGVALFSSGVGTLLHLLITHGKIPAYMGSSFAFIIPMASLMKSFGYPAVAQGVLSVGVVYLIVALVVSAFGSKWIDKVFPPEVVGPIVIVIGLSLATSAATNATVNSATGKYEIKFFIVALVTLGVTIAANMFLKGFLGLIPVLVGIIVGYLFALAIGVVDLSGVAKANWFALPAFNSVFESKQIYWSAILSMAPLALVTISEHLGHIMVLNKITGRNFFVKPGLNKTLTGDGVASIAASLVGGPSVTSYGENIGVMQISKVYSVAVIGGAATFAIIFSFVGKLSALISSIPGPVIGGVGFMLYGVIASAGLQILIDNKVDYSLKRNLSIAAPILLIGIGNFHLDFGNGLDFSGVAIATFLGIILNLILPKQAASEKETVNK